jgi:aryl-alcohol dehydrogenase-like predicted oxidoreductase
MIKRQLGSTDLVVSVVGFGSWAVGGWLWGEQDDADSVAAIQAALDAGVNWIDTAPIYGSGRSERVVGQAIAAIPRERRPLIFTKFGLGDDSNARRESATYEQIIQECDASLKRLGVERIDLYQLHWPTPTPIEETARACAELLKHGKIRAVGVCNFSAEQLNAWRATGLPLHCLQPPYSVFRAAAADTVLPWCVDHDIGAIAYSPLFRGMLFGTWKSDKTFGPGDSRGTHKDYQGPRFLRHLQAVDELKAIAAEDDLTCAQLCIGALLCTPGLTGCIVGARNAVQGAAVGELGMPITSKQLAAVETIVVSLQKDLQGMT